MENKSFNYHDKKWSLPLYLIKNKGGRFYLTEMILIQVEFTKTAILVGVFVKW